MLIRDTDDEDPAPPMKIIGVVEDMIAQSPYEPVKQGMYVYDRYGNFSHYKLRLNPKQSAGQSLAVIERVFKTHFPDIPFEYQFVDDEYGRKFSAEERVGSLAGIFTALAILISCLGLFGLTSFVAEQRTKEIGVRKVLGATVFNVWNMLSKDFLKLVTVSCFIAIPIAYYVMNGWLQEYPYRVILEWWIFCTGRRWGHGNYGLDRKFSGDSRSETEPSNQPERRVVSSFLKKTHVCRHGFFC